MCPWEHFRAYDIGDCTVDRALGACFRELSYNLPPAATQPSGDFARRKVSSTRYMCPWEHLCAYGVEIDGRSCLRWCTRELSYKSPPAATQPSWRFLRRKVSSTRYMCPWEHFRAYGVEIDGRSCPEVVYQRVVVQLRLQPPLNRVGDFARRKVSSTRYMCPWEHFRAYGVEIVGRSCPRWCTRELSYKSPPAATQPSWRFRPAEGVEHKVHVSVGTFMCVWRWRLTVDRARGGVPESCRTSRLQPPLNRVGDFVRRKVSSTRYMCPWEHLCAYGAEIDGRSCLRWCIRELSYNSAPPAT